MKVIIILFFVPIMNCHLNETKKIDIKRSVLTWTDQYDEDNGIWSKILEDYTLSKTNSKTNRMGRMEGSYYRYIPTSDLYIRRTDDSLTDNSIQNKPMTLQNSIHQRQEIHEMPSPLQSSINLQPPHSPSQIKPIPHIGLHRQNFQVNNHGPSFHQSQQSLREVSETDLYLLGAIEKLVYRVDYLENRIRRSEQLIYYLMAGNNDNKKEISADPCPKNFTRIGDNCYYISSQKLNWKSANQICKTMSSHLAEFETVSENESIVAYVLNNPEHRAKDFWLGGLNPGLLWIWANSAKPVNPNSFANLTASVQNGNSTENSNKEQNKIVNNISEIKGNGRCLKLNYNSTKHTYHYYGQECTTRHNFFCEFEDKTTENQLKKIGRFLNLF